MAEAIGLLISLIHNEYSPVVPALVEQTGTLLWAGGLQYLLSGLLGAGCTAASVIWEMERISLFAQTALAFAVYTIILLPTPYILHWMEHTPRGILICLAILLGTFLLTWIAQFIAWKQKIRGLNEKLNKRTS